MLLLAEVQKQQREIKALQAQNRTMKDQQAEINPLMRKVGLR